MKQRGMAAILESLEQLSLREKLMLGGLIAAFVGFAIFGVYWFVGKQTAALEERNANARETLAAIMEQKDAYLLDKAKIEANKKALDENKLRLVEEMEKEAAAQGFKIEDFKENKRYLTENYRRMKKREDAEAGTPKKKVKDLVEETQTVSIRQVTLKELAGFLSALEGRREPVRSRLLSITTSGQDRQKLREVRLTIATYRNEEVEM